MTTEENKALTRTYFEGVWNERRLELLDEILAPVSVLHVNGEDKVGLEAAHAQQAMWFACFPDVSVAIEDQIAEGDRVCDRLIVSGTHTGAPYLGIEAAGKAFRFTETSISRIEDGRIIEAWADLDFFNFVRQLGVTIQRPVPAANPA